VSPRRRSSDSFDLQERAVRACAQLPGAELTYPFNEDAAVFKVGGKMFAVVSERESPGLITLKCDPDYATYLTQHFEDIVPGYHMNKRHWITLTLTTTMSRDLVDELISGSYELVLATLSVHAREALSVRRK
jgi:predicted DNA-binding protein (MmcQ/YjbR family)